MRFLAVKWAKRFRRDVQRLEKSGYDLQKLRDVVRMLSQGQELPERHRHHRLKGVFSAYHECHIGPDWLLIYERDDVQGMLTMARTGTHAQLFLE